MKKKLIGLLVAANLFTGCQNRIYQFSNIPNNYEKNINYSRINSYYDSENNLELIDNKDSTITNFVWSGKEQLKNYNPINNEDFYIEKKSGDTISYIFNDALYKKLDGKLFYEKTFNSNEKNLEFNKYTELFKQIAPTIDSLLNKKYLSKSPKN